MADENLETGLAQLQGRQALNLGASQLGVRNLIAPLVDSPSTRDHRYAANDELWHALLSESVRATAIITLEDFWLSEWFPLRPGLYHTPQGRDARQRASRYLLTGPGASPHALREFRDIFGRDISPETLERFTFESTYVYSPHGKTMMLDGGVGCIRLKPKQLPGGQVWFMGASSEPFAHQGLPVAVPDDLYKMIIEQIAAEGSARCTLTGRLCHVPSDFDPLYRDLVGVPQLYLLVDQLERSTPVPGVWFTADGAVMVEAGPGHRPPEGEWDLADGIYAAFVSFFPGMPDAVNIAARWLAEIYVGDVLCGRVLTDFDEQVKRFHNTAFSLEQVMGGRISRVDAERLLVRTGASEHDSRRFIQKIDTVNGDITNINISGSGNVVATGNSAAAGPGGAAATRGSSTAFAGMVDRAKSSRWVKVSGVIALLATAAATALVVLSITDIAIAGYALAVIAVGVAVIPLFRSEG